MKSSDLKKKVSILTFGCQMNEYDTELIRSILQENGFAFTENETEAEVILLNTCAVRENAHRKVYGYIHALRHQRNGQPILGLLGCMATGLKQELLDDSQLKLDFIAGPDSYRRLPLLIREVEESKEKHADIDLSEQENYENIFPAREQGVNAWIAVMRGCDNFCSFCVVPYTRGRERSRSPESIVQEIKKAANDGFPQVTLLGQNVNSYKYDSTDFVGLLERITQIRKIRRIRFVAPHPKDFPKTLLDLMAKEEQLCKHIHLPLQAGNDRILGLMNRKYTQADFLALVRQIRAALPDVALTTDIIVGFPAETDEEFADTVRVMETIRFDSAFIFKYSPRKQTLASRKYPDDVPEEKKTERIVRLNQIQREISLAKNRGHIGKVEMVLVEDATKRNPGNGIQGRTDGNKVVVVADQNFQIGDCVPVRIEDASPNVLYGRPITGSGNDNL